MTIGQLHSVMETPPDEYVAPLQPAESYNGAKTDNYTWSQSISDLDVIVNVPKHIRARNNLKVDVSSTRIKVKVLKNISHADQRQNRFDDNSETRESPDEWTTIFQGQFSFPIKKNEHFWCLTSGKRVDVNFNPKFNLNLYQPQNILVTFPCLDSLGKMQKYLVASVDNR